MDGSINFIGALSGSIDEGGGGGGNVYDVKVKTLLQYESVVDEDDKTAYIDLSGYATKLELSGFVTSEALTTILGNYVTDSELSTELTSYQPKLTAGENITIDPVTNVISSSGGGSSWNYSTTPVKTGQKWIDGKDLYIQVIQANNLSADTTSNTLISNVDYYTCLGITMGIHGGSASFSPSQISMYNYQGGGTMYAVLYYDSTTHELKISNNSRTNAIDTTAIVMFTEI